VHFRCDKIKICQFIKNTNKFHQRNLAVNGDDLIAIGIPERPQIGAVLKRLTELVIDEQAENDRAALLEIAAGMPSG